MSEGSDGDAVGAGRRHRSNVLQGDASETSTNARLSMSVTARLTVAGVILSRRMMSALPRMAARTSDSDSTSTMIGLFLEPLRALSGRLQGQPASCYSSGPDDCRLDQDAVAERHTVIRSPTK